MQNKLDIAFETLADDTRRSIIARLSRQTLPVGKLASQYRMSFSGVSKHINVLEQAGFVVRQKKGRQVYVSLVPQALNPARKWLSELSEFWTQSFKKLDRHIRHS